MSPRDYEVRLVERGDIRDFVEAHHYSKSINGMMSSYCFGLYAPDETLAGAMIYGRLGMANTWRKYVEKEEDVLELRRLVTLDTTPKNTESYFIGHTLRWLRRNTDVKRIVSYADPNHGHEGIIYKATNFTHVGMTSPGRVIIYNGERFHDRAIRTKYKGELKPFAKRLKYALEAGEAHYEKQKPKHIYVKDLT